MKIGILLSLLTLQLSLFAQSSKHEEVIEVLEGLHRTFNAIDSIHYTCQMRFQGMGEDTFEVRNFVVDYRLNEANPLYEYDFKITEGMLNRDTLTHLILDTALIVIYNKNKQISQFQLPEVIEPSSYLEYIRHSFIFKEECKPFLDANAESITLIDSLDQFYLHVKMSEVANRWLAVDKNSFLPNKSISIITDAEFDFTQTTEICFNFDPTSCNLSDDAFSTQNYTALGYDLVVVTPEPDTAQAETQLLTPDEQSDLLNYPFTLSNGDTIRIKDYTSKYILLDFWFSSCLPCLKALPEINKLSESYSDLGLQVLGINCIDSSIKLKVEDKIRKQNIHIPLLFGERSLTYDIRIPHFPSYYLISPDRSIEFIDGSIADVKEIIEGIFGKD